MKLAECKGLTAAQARSLLSAFGLPEVIFGARRAQLEQVVDRAGTSAILASESPGQTVHLDHALAWSCVPGNHIVALDDARYPKQLLDIPDPPLLLYIRGAPETLASAALWVCGTERATVEGQALTRAMCETLAERGLAIVSGFADGIEKAAHEGALSVAGASIAVAATGVDRVFPARQAPLARSVAASGAIVSDLPLGTEHSASHWPRVYQLMSGLARGVLVIEARPNSRAMTQARSALENGREVFAMPGSVNAPLSKGPHALIKQGAKLVESADDIMSEFALPGLVRPK